MVSPALRETPVAGNLAFGEEPVVARRHGPLHALGVKRLARLDHGVVIRRGKRDHGAVLALSERVHAASYVFTLRAAVQGLSVEERVLAILLAVEI